MRAFQLVSAAAALVLMTAVGGFPTNGQAQDASGFRPEALQGICSDVRTGNSQRYERRINEAAGVQPDDTPAQRSERTSALFALHMPHCDGFNVRQGNILKYAVSQGTSGFIYSAVNVWGADLNQVDQSDGRTVLDYVECEYSRFVGTPRAGIYDGYRNELRRGGAKTRAQLEAEGRRFPGIPQALCPVYSYRPSD